MSNSTVEAFPSAPVDAPSPAPSPVPTSPAFPAPTLPASKSQSTFYISWFGIVGILAAFLVLALVALVCFWHKRNAYRKSLQEQRNYYIQNAARIHSDASDDEEQQKRPEQMTLVDWALPEWRSNAGPGVNPCFAESPPPLDIPVYTRPKKIVPGSFRDKHMNPSCDSPVGEVFYTGEEGSQMGAFRFSRAELGSIEILTRVATPKKRKAESETTSLLGNLHRSHTIAATRKERPRKWSLRTFSLPAKPSPESVLTSWGLCGETKLETLRTLKPLTPKPSSLPASPAHSFNLAPAHGHNLTLASWSRKPSRLSVVTPAFVPSTPPPPLPLPATVDEGEKTLKELRRELKHAESKWTIAPYCPSAPPPPLPIPFQAPPAPPPPPLPPPRALPSKKLLAESDLPPPPPPPPPLPGRKLTPPPSPPTPPPLPNDGRKLTPPPSPPPPPNDGRKVTPPPSPPPLPNDGRKVTPPPSPPPPPTPAPSPPSSVSRPKLTPLMLPGRPDLREDFQRSSKRHQKMRPLHWDKLKPDSDRTVWDNISNSMELDEEMIENLFSVSSKAAASGAKRMAASTPSEKNEILDPRKAHNIAIQLRARGLSRVEVCDALTEGDDLGQETLELLVKMSPTDEETAKFQEYQGDPSLLGPADRFILGVLEVPNAFERLDAMLYRASFEEELQHIEETISTLEMACKELRGSRTFTKLLEAVLKTGNRLNMGTFRGDAKAFKLDTLLKLADVKGVDGKTTLLHFVIQEIIKAEGARAARLAGAATPTSVSGSACTTPSSTTPPSSPLSHFARAMEAELERCQSGDGKDDFRKIGMDVVRGIPSELDHVRKAGGLDILALKLAVSRLHSGLDDMKLTLEKLTSSPYEDDVFREKMLRFVHDAETEVAAVQRNLDVVLASVKDISIYFYGEGDTAKSTQPLKVFVVMREFLAMLEQACKDVDVMMNQALQLPSSRRPSLSLPKS